jgi:hypothetical protein
MKSGLLEGGIPFSYGHQQQQQMKKLHCSSVVKFITLFAASKCKLRALGSISSTTVVAFSNVFNSATRLGII